MEEPLISIIVPCYNAEEYLHETIESIEKQTYSNWELLLVDDGSKDRTPQICDEYAAGDKRIKVIRKKNGGVSSARNVALDEVKGEWLTFLDSDDWFEQDTLSVLLNRTEGSDLVQFNHYYNYPNKQICRKPFSPNTIVRRGKALEHFLFDTFTPYYDVCRNKVSVGAIRGVWGKFFKTSIIQKHRIRFIESLTIAEDALFCYDYISHSDTVSLYNEYKLHYRVNASSIMQGYKADIEDINDDVLKAYIERSNIRNTEYQAVLTAVLAECLFRTFKLKYFHKQSTLGLKDVYEHTQKLLESQRYKEILSFNNHSVLQGGKRELIFLANKKWIGLLIALQYLFVGIMRYRTSCDKSLFLMYPFRTIHSKIRQATSHICTNKIKENKIYDPPPPKN